MLFDGCEMQSWNRSGKPVPVRPDRIRTGPDRLRKSTGPVKTGISPVETFKKYPLLTLFLAIKTKMSHISFGRVRKKVLKTHVILIICSKILCKKIDYVECLLHALLNYLIFWVMFSKNCFTKEFAIFSPVSPVGHVIPTGRFPTGPDR
jgi:hypothetical protein